jgi:hypothetical protein
VSTTTRRYDPNALAAVLADLPPHEVLRACGEAVLSLRTYYRIRAGQKVRYGSVVRLAKALARLGLIDDSPQRDVTRMRFGE